MPAKKGKAPKRRGPKPTPVMSARTLKEIREAPESRRNAPGQGVPVPDDVRRLFAMEFLRTGSIAAASRVSEIPERTGWDLAKKLEVDPTFKEARKNLLANALERAATMVLAGAEIAHERGSREAVQDGNGNLVDVGPAYLRVVNDAHRTLLLQRKHDLGPTDDEQKAGPVEIVIRQHGKPSDPEA